MSEIRVINPNAYGERISMGIIRGDRHPMPAFMLIGKPRHSRDFLRRAIVDRCNGYIRYGLIE